MFEPVAVGRDLHDVKTDRNALREDDIALVKNIVPGSQYSQVFVITRDILAG